MTKYGFMLEVATCLAYGYPDWTFAQAINVMCDADLDDIAASPIYGENTDSYTNAFIEQTIKETAQVVDRTLAWKKFDED